MYSAAGVYDPSIPPVEGDLAEWFHKEIMGRDDAAIEAERTRADAYFQATFGALYAPGSLVAFGVDPRLEYRAYLISGLRVPPEGFVVRDGGFRAVLFFLCSLSSDDFEDFGGGLAQGISSPKTLADGRVVANIRNILTLPGLGFSAQP